MNQAMETGPSGLFLGTTHENAPALVRLFRPGPTTVFASLREYMVWIIAYRAAGIGAHISIVTNKPRSWSGLVSAVDASSGTIEVTGSLSDAPTQGRPYRPSLIIDDLATGSRTSPGPWQAVFALLDASTNAAIHAIRACDLVMCAPCDARAAENLRKAYLLSPEQQRLTSRMEENELVIAQPRRISRVAMPPTRVEYDVMFAS